MCPSSAAALEKPEPSSAGHWPSGQSFEPEKDWHQEDPGAELEGLVCGPEAAPSTEVSGSVATGTESCLCAGCVGKGMLTRAPSSKASRPNLDCSPESGCDGA